MNIVCERKYVFIVIGRILHCDLGGIRSVVVRNIDNVMNCFFVIVDVLYKTLDTALIAHIVYYGFFSAFIGENYADTGIKERLFAKSFEQSVIFKFKSFENFGIGEKRNFRSRFFRIFKYFCGRIGFSAFIFLKNVFMRS